MADHRAGTSEYDTESSSEPIAEEPSLHLALAALKAQSTYYNTCLHV